MKIPGVSRDSYTLRRWAIAPNFPLAGCRKVDPTPVEV